MIDWDKPYKEICCKRCWFAKKKRCKCKCKGEYHQRGLVKQLEADKEKKQ